MLKGLETIFGEAHYTRIKMGKYVVIEIEI